MLIIRNTTKFNNIFYKIYVIIAMLFIYMGLLLVSTEGRNLKLQVEGTPYVQTKINNKTNNYAFAACAA